MDKKRSSSSNWGNISEANMNLKKILEMSNQNEPKPLSKEALTKVLQALDTAGVLNRLKQNDTNLSAPDSTEEPPRAIKDLTPVRKFIQTIEQAAAPENTQEFTSDDLKKGIAEVMEALFSQIANSQKQN